MTDADARQCAMNPETSAWVSANAGTGKTFVLTRRVARLLLAGVRPERILCLTFTKVAAAEMVAKLSQLLGAWALMPDHALRDALKTLIDPEGRGTPLPPLSRARQLFARALETPGGLKIQTLHAFCERLLRRFPGEASILPNFEVLEETGAEALRREALARTLAAAPGSPLATAIAHAATAWRDDDLPKTLFEITRFLARRQGDPLARHDVPAILAQSRAALGLAPGDTPEMVRAAARRLTPDAERDLRRLARALARGGKCDQANSQVLAAFIATPETERDVAALSEVFLTDKGAPRKPPLSKDKLKIEPDLEVVYLAAQERVSALHDRLQAAEEAQLLDAGLTLAAAMADHYDRAKEVLGVLDFDDLILRARSLLTTPGTASWVLYKLDQGIDHILIDEAQDTSREQWDIIRALTDEFFSGAGLPHPGPLAPTIFAVGDEKQSIFSFQGADPAAFAETRTRLEARAIAARRPFANVRLQQSRRSSAPVLQAVDLLFAGEAAARRLTNSQLRISHSAARTGQAGRVVLLPLVQPDPTAPETAWDAPLDTPRAGSPEALLAREIARRVSQWLTEGRNLAPAGRPIAPGDVLILLQRRGKLFDDLVRELKRHNVPVAGADRLTLTAHIAVMDLIALGSVVLMPEDDLTLAALLKSPLYKVSETTLQQLALDRPGSLWAALAARHAQLGLTAVFDELAALVAMAPGLTPFAFYGEVLGPRNGRRRLLAQLTEEARDPIEEFLTRALGFEREAVPSLQAFLAALAGGKAEVKRDMDTRGDAVRLMTAHGAKGLEAPIVILPDTTYVRNAKHLPLLHAAEQGAIVTTRGGSRTARAAQAAARAQQAAESERLLYVAMTRARDQLYLAGASGTGTARAESWYAALTERLQPHLNDDGEARVLECPQTAPPDSAGTGASVEPPAPELPPWIGTPAPPEPARTAAAPSQFGPAMRPLGPAARGGEDARLLRGRIIHRLLQGLPELAPADRPAAALRHLARAAPELGPTAHGEIVSAVLAVIGSPELADLFGPHSRAEVSLIGPVAALPGQPLVHGTADRLVITPSTAVVADFKTDRVVPEDAAQVPLAHLRQIALYAALLDAAAPGRRIGCRLVYTGGPRVITVPAPALAAALAGLADPGALTGPPARS